MKKIKPYKFQKKGVKLLRHKHEGRGLLADDPGLGKTLQSILAALPYRRKRIMVVVCPSGVKYQWQREIRRITKFDSWIAQGQKPPSRIPYNLPPVIIVNWEILSYWYRFLKKLNPSVVIGDEIHYIKNRYAKRSKAFKKLCKPKSVICVYGLSGTPFENYPSELWTILNILRPNIFPNFRSFGDRFCDPKTTPWGIKYEGATRKKELRKLLLKTCMVRRRFEDVIKDLPPINRSVIPIPIIRKKYEEAEQNIVKWLIKHKPEKAYKARYVNHLAKMNYLLQYTAELKIDEVKKWIDNFLETTDEKLVVFGFNRKFLEELHNSYKRNSVLRYGRMSDKKKEEVFYKFRKKKKTRIFFMSSSGMTGLDGLQKISRYMAVTQLVWNPQKVRQLEKRLHRMMQKRKVFITYLIAKDTVESLLCSAIIRKQKNFDIVIDGKKGNAEFNILKTVMRKLTKRGRKHPHFCGVIPEGDCIRTHT